MSKQKETLEQYLARGGKITVCAPLDNRKVIDSLKPKYAEIMAGIDKHNGRAKRKTPE